MVLLVVNCRLSIVINQMSILILLVLLHALNAEPCLATQPCKTKWVYQVPTSNLSNSLYISNTNPALALVISSPVTLIKNLAIKVLDVPTNYTLVQKSPVCGSGQICCSNQTYQPSNITATFYNVGPPILQLNLSVIDGKSTTENSQAFVVANSYFDPMYSIENSPLDLGDLDISNKYLIDTNDLFVTQQFTYRPLLVPQSFYMSPYSCKYLGLIDSTICSNSCRYFLTVSNISQMGNYQLPGDFSYGNQTLVSRTQINFSVKVTIYDPVSTPNVSSLAPSAISVFNQLVFMSNQTYCLNMSLINPTGSASLADIQVNSSGISIYKSVLVFEQYQLVNISVCSAFQPFIVRVDGNDYTYNFVPPDKQDIRNQTQQQTLIEDVGSSCDTRCYWWVWLLIALFGLSLIGVLFCIVRCLIVKRVRENRLLQAKMRTLAGIPTEASLQTMTDLTLPTQPNFIMAPQRVHFPIPRFVMR